MTFASNGASLLMTLTLELVRNDRKFMHENGEWKKKTI